MNENTNSDVGWISLILISLAVFIITLDTTFMNVVRKYVYQRLKEKYSNVEYTYGYITKNTRIKNKIEKSHINDATCISGNPTAKSNGEYFYLKKVRCHNRQIHKKSISKGEIRKKNQSDYIVKGYRLFDKVLYNEQECFIFGKRSTGYFDIRKADGEKIHASASYKIIKLIEKGKHYLIERKWAIPPTT